MLCLLLRARAGHQVTVGGGELLLQGTCLETEYSVVVSQSGVTTGCHLVHCVPVGLPTSWARLAKIVVLRVKQLEVN